MNGFTEGSIETLPKGKNLKVLLLDGNHFANVIYGHYNFQELLEHAIVPARVIRTLDNSRPAILCNKGMGQCLDHNDHTDIRQASLRGEIYCGHNSHSQ
jgi:hypothetical protein